MRCSGYINTEEFDWSDKKIAKQVGVRCGCVLF
jgi:hypothetical protein